MPEILLTILPPWGRPTIPIGLGYLSQFLLEHNLPHSVEDLNMEIYHRASKEERSLWDPDRGADWSHPDRFKELLISMEDHIRWAVERLDRSPAELIGFSINQSNNRLSVEVARRLRKRDPGRILIFGGQSVSLIGERSHIPDRLIDLFVVGEGEVTLLHILELLRDGKPIHNIPGTVSAPMALKHARRPLMDMEQLAWPTYDKFDLDRYPNNAEPFPLSLGRGCICRCSFCGDYPLWGKYRSHRGCQVVDAIRHHVYSNGIMEFEFNDLAVNSNPEALNEICEGIIEEGIIVQWSSYAYIEDLTPYQAAKLRASGCVMLRFGMESASDSVLERMHKPHRAAQAAEMFANLTEAGINCNVGLMVGFPNETKEELDETIAFLVEHQENIHEVDSISVFYVKPMSGVEKHPENFGITLPGDDASRWNRWVGEDGSTYKKRVSRAHRLLKAIEGTSIKLQRKNIFGL